MIVYKFENNELHFYEAVVSSDFRILLQELYGIVKQTRS